MRLASMLIRRLRALFLGGAVDRELADEMAAHLEHLIAQNVARGMAPDEARAAATREFGSTALLMDESRDERGVAWLATAWSDVRYGIRLMSRSPGFAAVAILTVALGIGAATAMFSVVYSVVLQPLPYREPGRLVRIWTNAQRMNLPRAFVGAANARDWREQNAVFEDLGLYRTIGNFNLTGMADQGAGAGAPGLADRGVGAPGLNNDPERLLGSPITANIFPLLGVSPLVGRAFTPEENEIGREFEVILSHRLWMRRFGGDPSVVGRAISLNGRPYTVVGVMKPDFHFPGREFELWTPLTINPDDYRTRMSFNYVGLARLKPGVSVERAHADLEAISARLARQYPDTNQGIAADVVPLHDDTVAAVRRPLYVLLAAIGALVLVGCANLAGLVMSRALARRRELQVRAALGASRGRLVAQSVAELLPMLALGGLLGVAAARGVVRAVVPLLPADVPRAEEIAVHWPVLLAAAAALAFVAVVAGIWPALDLSRRAAGDGASLSFSGISSPASTLSSGRGATARVPARDALVVAQIASTLVLLVAALLLMRSFARLAEVNPGFSTDRVLTANIAIPRAKYGDDRDVQALCTRVLERVAALPGVAAVGMVNRLPLSGIAQIGGVTLEGHEADDVTVDWRSTTPDYFRVMGIPVLKGRAFTERDREGAAPVGIIDERLAARFFANGDAVGRRFRAGVGTPWTTIVGVVGHVRHDRLEEDSRPQVYWNYLQRAQDRMVIVAKARRDPGTLAASVVSAVRSVDPDQPVYDVRLLEDVVDRSLATRWLQTTLLATFAAMAVLLASIGVYGVIAYGVGQRTREFGIRLALGATRAEIVSIVIGRGAKLFAWGAAVGLLAALASARLLGALLFQVSGFDPVSFAGATAILLCVSLLACSLPARRAAAVDASIALRTE